jgi:hypothetical protein
MNTLKPLLYLAYRTIYNGLKRAVTTPRRLIYFLFFVGYYFLLFVRPAFTSGATSSMPAEFVGKFDFPPLQVLDAFIFAIFVMITILMSVTVATYQPTLRAPDVDVLFPTPISPKVVLGFRICRDYLFTLLTPFFVAIIGLRASKQGWEAVFRQMPHPEYSGLALRTLTVTWLLMAMCFVAITHAVSMYTNRTDRDADRNRKIFSWTLGLFVFGSIGYLAWRIGRAPDTAHLIALAEWPPLRLVFFLASFATEMAMSPFQGSVMGAALGIAGMGATIAIALKVAFSQIGWYYDQTAVRGFYSNRQRELQRSGDYVALTAERARSGKFKVWRIDWLYRMKLQGSKALIWKEFFIQPRTLLSAMIIMVVCEVGFSTVLSTQMTRHTGASEAGVMMLVIQATLTFMMAMIFSQAGFVEVLRRVDLQKPLPFAPASIVFYETLGRSTISILASVISSIGFILVRPPGWQFGLAGLVGIPCLAILFSSMIFFVTMLFPDVEDPSQRQFRALMTLLGFAITLFLPAGAFIGIIVLGSPVLLAALVGGIFALGIALLLSTITGGLYANFNPNE